MLLRRYSAVDDSRAVEVFDDIIQNGFEPIESVIADEVSLCAEPRYVQMAEHTMRRIAVDRAVEFCP